VKKQKQKCQHKKTKLVDLTIDRMFGNVICVDCGKFIRTYDAD